MTERTPWSPQRISFSRNDGLPKYLAIARAVALAITEEELTAGETLPSQKELAESFGVTVMTVRQAVQTLTDQGLLSTEQGKGTYVRSRPYRLEMGPLASFAAQIAASGRTLRTEVLGYAAIEVSPLEQRRMALPTREAFELVRLRYVDGEPLILQTSLLSPAVAAGIEVATLETRSLYDVLSTDLGIRIDRATETVQATNLDAESAGLLHRAEGEAALLSARLTLSADGVAVVDDRALTAGDSVVVSAERRADEPGLELVLSSDAPIIADESTPFVRGGR
ncbi:GntR family transcriptional regulator [Microbacterium sp. dk485]|uniref:GntR family transcriptional regulator n=1 Tax=Microbacterium sp. dk485 TaxID=2560021 RepID=UPI0010741FB4|nr:GntR family transcriptional regulator [Microbacterium sp. dk485]TFV84646.1 GntR family transcriptional regulator [Microbacterium sp. dk485]